MGVRKLPGRGSEKIGGPTGFSQGLLPVCRFQLLLLLALAKSAPLA
jgi:hypothetical protein